MSCCASRRPPLGAGLSLPGRPLPAPAGAGAAPARPLQLVFERVDPRPLLLTGPASGRQYHFRHAGELLAVDPRDAPALTRVAGLRRL